MKRTLTLFLCIVLLTGCCACGTVRPADPKENTEYASVLTVTINPEFKLYLNNATEVIMLEPMNSDAENIMEDIIYKDGASFRGFNEVMGDILHAADQAGFLMELTEIKLIITETNESRQYNEGIADEFIRSVRAYEEGSEYLINTVVVFDEHLVFTDSSSTDDQDENICRECDGSGTCRYCGGDGEQECRCEGTGTETCRCGGSGIEVCGQCDGTGKHKCSVCGQSGIDRGETCKGCNGTGWATCGQCGGDGVCTCHQCEGTGICTCGDCQGAGHRTCDTCGGTGKCSECGGSGIKAVQ